MFKKIGDRLFLVGVAHVLPKSMHEVEKIISQEQPSVVALELCQTRYWALTEPKRKISFMDALRSRRLTTFAFGYLIQLLQNKFARQTGMPAGEEMLTAANYAQKINAKIELIDRDINLTLQRLAERMNMYDKLKLLSGLILGFLSIGKKIDLEKLTEEEVINHLLQEFKRTYPAAYEVLIEERNTYMAERIAMLLTLTRGKVVCVVGAGHISGLAKKLAYIWSIEYEWATN